MYSEIISQAENFKKYTKESKEPELVVMEPKAEYNVDSDFGQMKVAEDSVEYGDNSGIVTEEHD